MEVLSVKDRERFCELNLVIERGTRAFLEVGTALLEIRDNRLYRECFATFEDYCEASFGLTYRRCHQLISTVDVVNNLGTSGSQIPPNVTSERQVRPLSGLPPDQQREAWQAATAAAPNGKPTAKHTQAAADKIAGRAPPAHAVITECDDPTTVTDAAEDHAERAAIAAEITDEEWLAALPLSAKLRGQCLLIFRTDALRFRNMAKARDSYRYAWQHVLPKDSSLKGIYTYLISRSLKIESPDRWLLCPTPENGGCAGTGMGPAMLASHCPKCRGRGYWIK